MLTFLLSSDAKARQIIVNSNDFNYTGLDAITKTLDSYADGSIDKSQYASFGKINDRAAYDTASFYTDVPDGA